MRGLEEEYLLSGLFEEVYEAACQTVGESSKEENNGNDTTGDEDAPSPPKESSDEDFAEDIGYDEDYSNTDIALYTPTASPTIDGDDLADVPPLKGFEENIGDTGKEDNASSATTPEPASKDSPAESHRSALPTYLMGLPQLTLSAAFAQGRRGSTPVNDNPVSENATSYFAADDEPDTEWSDSNSSPRRQSAPGFPTVVDIVAQYRTIIRDEWLRVFQDATEASNLYYSTDHWDKDALDNYTRFPHFGRHSAMYRGELGTGQVTF